MNTDAITTQDERQGLTQRAFLYHAGVFSFYLILSAIYFYEAFTRGVVLADTGDAVNYFYPLHMLADSIISGGELPLWNPHVFSGMPLMGAHQPGLMYPPTLTLLVLMGPKWSFNLDFILHYALGAYFTFLFIRSLTRNDMVALFAGLSMGFLGYFHINPDHLSILRSSVWLPLMLFIVTLMRPSPRLSHAALLAMAMALQFLAGHAQTVVYSQMLVMAYAVFLYLDGGRGDRKLFALGIGMAVIGSLLLSLPQLIATLELMGLSVRASAATADFTAVASYSLTRLPMMLLPAMEGAYSCYVGLFTLFGALAVLSRPEGDRRVYFWSGAALVFLVLSLGHNSPLYALLGHLPVYGQFRGAERHWLEIQMALVVLMSLGLKRVSQGRSMSWWMAGWMGAGLILVLAVGAAYGPGLGSPVVYLPLMLALMYLAAVTAIAMKQKPRLIYALFIVLAMEAASERPDLAYWDAVREEVLVKRPASVLSVMGRGNHGRIGFFSSHSAPGELGVSSIAPASLGVGMLGGYDPFAPGDYTELLGMDLNGEIRGGGGGLVKSNALLSMLGVRHLVLCGAEEQAADHRYMRLMQVRGCGFYMNMRALPRAYLPLRAEEARGVAEVRERFMREVADPGRVAFLSSDELSSIGLASKAGREFKGGSARIIAYRANSVEIEADMKGRGLLVLADQFYPGWRVYVDGSESRVLRVNGVLRGVLLPGGRHMVSFAYKPVHIYMAALAAALLWPVFLLLGMGVIRRK